MNAMISHGGTIAAAFLCWIPLVAVVGGLIVGFFFTNRTAFSRDSYEEGRRKPTGGAFDPDNKGWRWQ